MTAHRPISLLLALALVVSACGDDGAATTTTAALTTTTPAPSTTDPPTTTDPPAIRASIEVSMEGDDGAVAVVRALYAWVGDRTLPTPAAPGGLLDVLADVHPTTDMSIDAVLHAAALDTGRVAVLTADDDIVLLADEGSGWKVVGGHLARFGVGPWYGPPVRHILILGTDARPGESQPLYRADSIHIVSANAARGAGTILGFPRDTYVRASYGPDKFTHVNALAETHSTEMVEIAERISGLEIEGYILAGFTSFRRLVNAFGGVVVDVPYFIDDWRAEALISKGVQRLFGDKALGFSRTRRISGGDFSRSANQGKVMVAALIGTLERDITQLPDLLAILIDNSWTDLSLGELLTLGATAFLLDPDAVTNRVLPGTVGIAPGGASVVFLDERGSAEVFDDLLDGVLDS